jgi:chromosome segregation ATPase
MEWALELVLVGLLLVMLFHAIRLERALVRLRRDRASLEKLVTGFAASTQQAESGIQRVRSAADGAGQQLETQLAKSISLKDDLAFLTERGDRLADRLEALVREARPLAREHETRPIGGGETAPPIGHSQVERDILQALRMAR